MVICVPPKEGVARSNRAGITRKNPCLAKCRTRVFYFLIISMILLGFVPCLNRDQDEETHGMTVALISGADVQDLAVIVF